MPEERVLILAYDGLEIDLVEKFEMSSLKQKEYGKTNISEFNKISTPILWASFVTGQNFEPRFASVEKSGFLEKIFVPPYLFLKGSISAVMADSLRKFAKRIMLFQKTVGSIHHWNIGRDPDEKDIFDFVEDAQAINVPAYSKNEFKELSTDYGMKDKIEGKVSDSDYIDDLLGCFERTKDILWDNLDRDLVMAWFKAADGVGHFWRTDREVMGMIYRKLNDFTREVKEEFDGWVLIVSDHGMKPFGKHGYGDHTNINYGYYSSSRQLGLKNPRITDFYGIIEDILRGDFNASKYSTDYVEESEEEEFEGDEEEEFKKRLKDLGYFD